MYVCNYISIDINNNCRKFRPYFLAYYRVTTKEILNFFGQILDIEARIAYIYTMIQNEQEVWSTLKNYDRLYLISNFGKIQNKFTGKILVGKISTSGYVEYLLRDNLGNRHCRLGHRIVALTFIPNPENKPQVNHKNGVKTDNRVENLEWVTSAENIKHSIDKGLQNKASGESHGSNKLKESDVLAIRKNKANLTQKQLSIIYKVSQSNISKIIQNKEWKKLKNDPNLL